MATCHTFRAKITIYPFLFVKMRGSIIPDLQDTWCLKMFSCICIVSLMDSILFLSSTLSMWWDLAIYWFQSCDGYWSTASCSNNNAPTHHPSYPLLSYCCLLKLLKDLWNVQVWFPCLKRNIKTIYFLQFLHIVTL